MPLNLKALPLEPDPESVKEARAWVREVLERLDREDIVETAELGVSELVTNAILHGSPPITVRVRGTVWAASRTQSTHWIPTGAGRWHSGQAGRPHRWHLT